MTTDTSEKGLETLIMRHMTSTDGLPPVSGVVAEESSPADIRYLIATLVAQEPDPAGTGYFAGSPKHYDRAHALDVPQLFAFLRVTQMEAFEKLAIADVGDLKDINRLKFLKRLSDEIRKRGVIDVLRKGVEHGPLHFDVFYGTRRRATPKPRLSTFRTAFPSRASLPTAWIKHAAR